MCVFCLFFADVVGQLKRFGDLQGVCSGDTSSFLSMCGNGMETMYDEGENMG